MRKAESMNIGIKWSHTNLYVSYNILVQYQPETDDQGIINNKLHNGLVGMIILIASLFYIAKLLVTNRSSMIHAIKTISLLNQQVETNLCNRSD